MLLQMVLFHSFLWLSNIPLCVCVCVYHILLIHSSVNTAYDSSIFSFCLVWFYFLLQQKCLTILCYFLLYSERNQLYVYTYPLPLGPLTHLPASHPCRSSQTLNWAPCALYQVPTSCLYCRDVDEPRVYHAEGSKSEKQILYINICVWNLGKWYRWTKLLPGQE